MAKKKSTPKLKEPVKVRFKKLANGNKSIYLDTYQNGQRVYEFLKLYLVPEVDEAAKIQNKNTLQAAMAIKAKRVADIINGTAGIKSSREGGKMLLTDWMQVFLKEQKAKGVRATSQIVYAIKVVEKYNETRGGKVMLKDVTKEYCKGFLHFLLNDYKAPPKSKKPEAKDSGKPIKPITAITYQRILTTALNAAKRAELINVNPFELLANTDRIHAPETEREYLTIEELKAMIAAKGTDHPEVRDAFLFSCYCGLRWGDVMGLTWADIQEEDGVYRLQITCQKTQKPLYLPLSAQAVKYLPERVSNAGGSVFKRHPICYTNKLLKDWAAEAGVDKNLSFHVARHTFATMMLTLGADLYTTSKLLGHSSVKTTQIYAKIIDQKKVDAVNLVNNIFGE